jgi:hypothetical protein
MKNTYKIYLIVFTVASMLAGCNLDVNQDPNRVTESTVTGALIFPAAAHETGQRIASGNFTFLNNWLGYWSGSGSFAIDATETTYNITPGFSNNLWQNTYNTLFDLEQSRIKALAENDTVLAGAAIILSARLWQDMVDTYGDIPYSQAFQYTKYPQPAYDKGQDIYNDLQSKLDLAITYMGMTAKSSFVTVDIVNKGDQAKWIKFANTLKLRLLIHESEVLGTTPTAEIAKIVANGGVLQEGETVSVNPGYTKATNKQSPFYANYGKTVNDADAAPSVKANKYFVDLLENFGDNRVYFYFDSLTTGGSVVPTVYGLAAGNPLTSSGVGPGLAKSDDQDQWILTSVESLFLEAEAIARGWMTGNLEEKYKSAVTESFKFLNVELHQKLYDDKGKERGDTIVTAEDEAKYYLDSLTANNDNNPQPSVDNTDVTHFSTVANKSIAEQVKFLAFQKYLAMAGIDPLESWTDLRRLGFDVIPDGYITVNPGKVSNTIPIRLPYAQNEYTTNGTNANAQGTIDPFTSKIFWDVN